MEVHNIGGPGHLSAVIQECLKIEFELREKFHLLLSLDWKYFIKIENWRNSIYQIFIYLCNQ